MSESAFPTPGWRQYANRIAASRALAKRVAADLKAAQAGTAGASVVVSGGTSPIEFFRFLRSEPINWRRVSVVPSDERRVPLDHPERNQRMVRSELLAGPAAAARLVSLIEPGADAVRERLADLLPFAAVVLGMGEDGHTASLFPNAPAIATALSSAELCLDQSVPGLPAARITLTPRALLDSARIYLLLFGEAKRRVYERAQQSGPIEELPVRFVLHQARVSVETYWAP